MATALDLTDEQLEKYVAAAHRRTTERPTEYELDQREAITDRVRKAARVLYNDFGATRVILFGSLAHEAWFTLDSDIDIVVEGIGDKYWRAWEVVEGIIGDRGVDLIDWDMAGESLRQTVSEEGILL